MERLRETLIRWSGEFALYAVTMGKWLLLSAAVGLASGVIGGAFHVAVEEGSALREAHPWLLWCLPLAGLAIVGLYKLLKTEGQGTNNVFDQVRQGRALSLRLLPAIFFSTILTHLCGGSAGREGAALQMGGVLGYQAGRLCRLDDADLRTATMTGMAAFFSALFGTPLSAAIFAIAVISIGAVYHAALVPCLTAALTAYGVARRMGMEPTHFTAAVPVLSPGALIRVGVLAALCGLMSMVFCAVIHGTEHHLRKRLPNPWLRVFAGGCAVTALTLLCGTTDYNGAGMGVIAAAVEQGTVRPEAFALKLLFTAVTLGAGFKGGEVVPSFFVGAAFGGAVGPLLGLPAGFAAEVGLVALFCGAANCPIASIILSVELFGAEGLLYYALACGVSYMVSGRGGLYSSQAILYSKWKLPATAAGMTVPAPGTEAGEERRTVHEASAGRIR